MFKNCHQLSDVFDVEFTPAEAQEIVEWTIARNANFRSPFGSNGSTINSSTLAYTDAMAHGRWNWPDAGPIRLGDDLKTCTDGLSRLTACWKSGVPLRSVVIIGDRFSAGTETDRGKSRSVAHVMASMGVTSAAATASSTRLLISRAIRTTTGLHNTNSMIHVDDVLELFKKFSDEISWVQGKAASVRSNMNISVYAALLVSLHQWDRDTAVEFHQSVMNTNLTPEHPVFVMRIAAARHLERTGKRWSANTTFAAMAKSFNAVLDNITMQIWRPPTNPDTIWPSGVDPKMYLLRRYGPR